MPKALPVLRLQFEQWQIPCMVGIAFTVIEACPQAHVAVIEVPSTGLSEVGSARPGVVLARRRPEDVRPKPERECTAYLRRGPGGISLAIRLGVGLGVSVLTAF